MTKVLRCSHKRAANLWATIYGGAQQFVGTVEPNENMLSLNYEGSYWKILTADGRVGYIHVFYVEVLP